MTILIRRNQIADLFTLEGLLADEGPASRELMPSCWNGPHIGLRVTEGFQILWRMPMGDCLSARSAWPEYKYEFEDLLAQQEQGDLERTQAAQNRTRIRPSAAEIARAEKATY